MTSIDEPWRTLLQASPQGVVLVDARAQVLDFNDAAAAQFGWSRTGATRPRLDELVLTEPPAPSGQQLASFLQGGEREARLRTPRGERRARVSVLPAGGGNYLFAITDPAVTAMEDALRESETRLSQAVTLAGLGIWDWEPATDKTVWNDEMLRIYGVTREAFTGKGADYIGATRADYRPAQLANIQLQIENGLTREQLTSGNFPKPPVRELCVVRPDGTERFTMGSAVVEVDAAGKPVRMIGVTRDVTDDRRAEQERLRLEGRMAQASKLESVGLLAGGVAHDFNNLLTVILACSNAIEDELVEGRPVSAEDVREIREAGERARDLTRQLLTFARKQVVKPVPLDLNSVVGNSQKMLRRLLGEDIELQVSLSPTPLPVRCDPVQLEQIIVNLSLNARDAMPTGGRLAIQTRSGAGARSPGPAGTDLDAWVRLTVSDTGVGLSPEAKDHLFEPFFTTKDKGKGTGLGLATVYGIVHQCGGHVSAVSEGGAGTRFEITLPRTTENLPSSERVEKQGLGGSEVVLVVEDDPHVRAVTVRSLRAGGYEVLVAANGAEAIALSISALTRVKLLVTDVVMPGMSGAEVARELCLRCPSLRVLYVSGYPEETIASRGELAPGVELLLKPFTSAALLARVRAVLDVH